MTAAQVISKLAFVVLLIAALFLFLPGARSRTPPDSASRDDDQYWLLGFLYNNPNDPNWRVPKRYVPGWTLNIGHPVGRFIMLGLVALVVVLALLSALIPGFSLYGCHPATGCHL